MLDSRGHGEAKRELTPEEFAAYRQVEMKYQQELYELSRAYERQKSEINQAFWKEADEAVMRIRQQNAKR